MTSSTSSDNEDGRDAFSSKVAYQRFLSIIINGKLDDELAVDGSSSFDLPISQIERLTLEKGPLATYNPLRPGLVTFRTLPI
ncbi:hypothetical protein L6452_31077 [Arctium lappa]|uniref:Uncharacterized protein n=1 Tax=Arctium lappa TaxID=4217 RepID=A0ACB8ZJX3_ARCLA|nr:hypothetical protein L6452_31077 [Arctium lappa]